MSEGIAIYFGQSVGAGIACFIVWLTFRRGGLADYFERKSRERWQRRMEQR